ncbi:MAG: polysaccharide pyruvyl transferase family protein [Lacunisphaera sp.]
MRPLTLEIYGTGTHNRGAELMAIAVAERMRKTFPEVRMAVSPYFGDFLSRAGHGFLMAGDFPGRFRGRLLSAVLPLSGASFKSSLGAIAPSEVDIVLDASGFAFSDQWGPGPAIALLNKMNRRDRRKQPLILLPQALGPFETPAVASAARALFARAEFVCARDRQSYFAAEKLGGARRLLRYPDFTLGVEPIQPQGNHLSGRFAAIVPNYRILDKTNNAAEYIFSLEATIERLTQAGWNPVFVLHDAQEDRKVIQYISKGRHIPIVTDKDPRVLKGILGCAELVIGSRFHALVSSLSQGIPCIGLGWSHKYPELFRDFDAEGLLISDMKDFALLERLLAE